MSEIPSSWIRVPIGQLCDLINGRAFKPSEWGTRGLPIIRIQNLNKPEAKFNYFSGPVRDKFLVQHGDLLFAWSGTPGTSFGAHVWTGGRAVLNQHIFKVVFDASTLERDFFRYAINQTLDELIQKAHGGVGLRHITKGKFEETEIALPPFEEQKRIVHKLSRLTARLRRAAHELDRLPTLIDKYRHAVLSSAFGTLLSSEDNAGAVVAPLSALVDDGPTNGWSPKSGPDAQGALTLKLTATTSGELRLDDQATKRIYETPGSNSRFWLEPGDLLVQRANTIEYLGAAAIFSGPPRTYIYPDLMMRLRVSDRHVREYLWRFLNSMEARSYLRERASGTAGNMPKISGSTLKSLPVPVPADGNFQRVNQAINRALAWISTVKTDVEKSTGLITHLEHHILGKAFSGTLVAQDSRDEPSAELLNRIKVLRQQHQVSPVRRGRTAQPRKSTKGTTKRKILMGKTRSDVAPNHLSKTLAALGGAARSKQLWQGSEMDIEEFYKQLRQEVKAGHIREGSKKDELVIADAS